MRTLNHSIALPGLQFREDAIWWLVSLRPGGQDLRCLLRVVGHPEDLQLRACEGGSEEVEARKLIEARGAPCCHGCVEDETGAFAGKDVLRGPNLPVRGSGVCPGLHGRGDCEGFAGCPVWRQDERSPRGRSRRILVGCDQRPRGDGRGVGTPARRPVDFEPGHLFRVADADVQRRRVLSGETFTRAMLAQQLAALDGPEGRGLRTHPGYSTRCSGTQTGFPPSKRIATIRPASPRSPIWFRNN